MQIRVNPEDGCFKSILSLYKEGFLDVSSSHKLIESATDDKIITPSAEFVLQKEGERDIVSEIDEGISYFGASWFAGFRGEDVGNSNSNAEWISLIESVSAHFHKNHSLLEYNSQGSVPTPQEVERDIARIRRVISKGWPRWGELADIREATSAGAMEIFGVGLRLDISNVGEPVAVIGRLYFCRRSDGELYPLRASTARSIDASIMEYDEKAGGKVSSNYRTEIVGQLLVKVEECFRRRDDSFSADEDGLEDWLYIYNPEDIRALEVMAEQGHSGTDGAVPLVCSGAKLLNIFHMIKPTRLYEVVFGGDTVLNAEFAMENEVTISCALCKSPIPIVENNIARLAKGGEVTINPDLDDLGITAAQLADIPFETHIKAIECLGAGCKKYRCDSALFTYDNRAYCRDCHRRDVVYPIGDKFYPTSALAYSSSTLTLVPKMVLVDAGGATRPGTRRCNYCERTFEGQGTSSYVCDFCACKLSGPDAAGRLYKKYSGALPLHVRMSNSSKSDKLCYEDSEFIMFVFRGDDGDGESRYYLNKYNLHESSKLSNSPKKSEV